MTPEEKEYYDNLKNDKSLNEYAFDQLFETINGNVTRLEDKGFRIIGEIPFITEAENSGLISELQIQNLESSNLEEINNIHQSLENPFDKKIIILSLDINKRGSFSDSFLYTERFA